LHSCWYICINACDGRRQEKWHVILHTDQVRSRSVRAGL
jgi:hypothetical protein